MLEIWNGVKAAKEMEVDWIVDIDFSRQEIGDQFITNFGSLDLGLVKGSKLDGLTAPHGVEDVPGFGRAFYFNGNVWFLNPNKIIPSFVGRDVIVEAEFKVDYNNPVSVVFDTGNHLMWVAYNGIVVHHNLRGYNITTGTIRSSSSVVSTTLDKTIHTVKIINNKVSTTATINGVENNQVSIRTAHSWFCIGGSGDDPATNGYGFNGYIKSIKIGFLD